MTAPDGRLKAASRPSPSKLNFNRAYNRAIRRWLLRTADFARRLDKSKLVQRACPVCGSSSREFFANNGALDYARCRRCSLIYMNPTFPPRFIETGFKGADRLLLEYFRIVRRFNDRRPPKPDPKTDGQLRDIHAHKRSGRLLDVGCSLGAFLRKAEHFYDVEGLEISPLTAPIAARRFNVHTDFLDRLNLPKAYDVVTLNQILYGLSDPAALLRDIRRVLKDDGILYINTPNADSHAMQLYKGQANHLYGYTTQNVFNRRSLQALARNTGFRVASFRTEWLDLYLCDIREWQDHPGDFIHKRNCQVPDYERLMAAEESLQRELALDLKDRGNYLVAVLRPA